MAIKPYICEQEQEVLFINKRNFPHKIINLHNAKLLNKDSFYKLHLDTLLNKNIDIIYNLEPKHDVWLNKFLNKKSNKLNKDIIWVFKNLNTTSVLYKTIKKNLGIITRLKPLTPEEAQPFINEIIEELQTEPLAFTDFSQKRFGGYHFEIYACLSKFKEYVDVTRNNNLFFDLNSLSTGTETDSKLIFKFLDNFFYNKNKDLDLLKTTLKTLHSQVISKMFFKKLMSLICYKTTCNLAQTKAYWNYSSYGLKKLNSLLNTIELHMLCVLYTIADDYLLKSIDNLTLEERWTKLIYEWQRISTK